MERPLINKMYEHLFVEFTRLSNIYNKHLGALEVSAFKNLSKIELGVKNQSLIDLYRINKLSMDNCTAIINKLRSLKGYTNE